MRIVIDIFIGVAIALGVTAVGLIWWAYGKNGALRTPRPPQTGDVITGARGHDMTLGARIKVGDTLYRVIAHNDGCAFTYREWRWFDWLIPRRLYNWWNRS